MLIFAEERVADCWDALYPLAAQHAEQANGYRRHEPFAPSRQRYEQANETGFFRLLTARDAGVFVGYFGLYVTYSMHSQGLMAVEDTFYLDPAHRGGRNALRFMQFMERQCREWGVAELLFSCEIDNQSGIRKLLLGLDYHAVITQYRKQLAPPTTCEASHVCAVTATTS